MSLRTGAHAKSSSVASLPHGVMEVSKTDRPEQPFHVQSARTILNRIRTRYEAGMNQEPVDQ